MPCPFGVLLQDQDSRSGPPKGIIRDEIDGGQGQGIQALALDLRLDPRFLDEIGYFNELRRSEKNPDTADNRVRNLKELIATMDNSGRSAQPAPQFLLEPHGLVPHL